MRLVVLGLGHVIDVNFTVTGRRDGEVIQVGFGVHQGGGGIHGERFGVVFIEYRRV